jgi:dynein heavy chain, axonemal
MRSNVEKLSDINKLIEEYRTEAELINRNQALLAWEVTPFNKLTEIVTAKDPYEKLWNTAWQFFNSCEQWVNGSFRGLNAEAIGDEVCLPASPLCHILFSLGTKHVANIA